jgi:hypothetical protein
MDRLHPYRPRVSRETRLLLITALVAIVALWMLARVRFPDRPAPQNPVQPLLTQLTPRPTFADLAAEIAALRPRLAPLFVSLPGGLSGLRVREDVAIVWLDPAAPGAERDGDALLRYDRASGLSLVRVASESPSPPLAMWLPEPAAPRYFIASEISPAGVAIRPVYVASLGAADNPRWPGQEWQLPADLDPAVGSFLFTADAAFAGLVVDHGGGPTLVPGATVIAEAERLLDRPPASRGNIGVEVQPLTPLLSQATGASRGLIVTWVDPRGPVDEGLQVGDVIESVNGAALATVDDWDVQVARLAVGQTVIVGVGGGDDMREVSVVASPPAPIDPASLGLTLRAVPGVGVEVVRVDPGSSGHRSGVRAGDVVTRIDRTDAPTPAEVRRAFAAAGERPLVVAFTRGTTRRVTALGK